MIIRNNTSKQLSVILNGKTYVFNAGDSKEVSEAEGEWIINIQPLLVKAETVEIHTDPVKIEKKEPKAKKDVKNKKSRK